MRFLDLFCCCGGISRGMKDAIPTAEITGVDVTDDHDYPFNFIHSNVFDLTDEFLEKFDLIHASPPCQHYSNSISKSKRQIYPDLVARIRRRLRRTAIPFTLENIPNSPLRKDLILCGEMFGLRVIRHRIFELRGFTILQPPHIRHKNPIDKKHSYYAQVAGHGGDSYSFKIQDHKMAMGIDWVSKKHHLNQMIPPAYYEYIIRSSPFSYCPELIQIET